MSSPYYQRKYAGAPHKELKQTQPAEPSKLGPRKPNKHKKDVVITDFWHIRPERDKKWGNRWNYRSSVYLPCCGKSFGMWNVEWSAEWVVKRLKCNLVLDKRMGIYWIEEQATKEQVSPEFSDYGCLINWLIHKGLETNWLYVSGEMRTYWREKPRYCNKLERV
jgi:hypothetical protein